MEEKIVRVNNFCDIIPGKICYYEADGKWYLYLPGCGLGGLGKHTVVENNDGTITVTPSILVTGHDNEKMEKTIRHGFVTNNIWREC